MRAIAGSIIALCFASSAALAQAVPAPGTLYTSPAFEGFPNGMTIGVVLCKGGKHDGRVGLFPGGAQGFAASNVRDQPGVLKARINRKNVFLDPTNREAMLGKFVPTGQPGRIPLTISLSGPFFISCGK